MAVPDYQSLMLPVLEALADGQERHWSKELEPMVVQRLELTQEDREELLPSGRQKVLLSRIGWARTYMSKAGLLKSVRRGFVQITPRGRNILAEHPDRIDNQVLNRFPEFIEFRKRRSAPKAPNTSVDTAVEVGETTPEEAIAANYEALRDELVDKILDTAKTCSPTFFENLVVDLLIAMGYGGSREDAGQAIGRSGDEGIDGVINEDTLGLDIVYIQAKRWEGTVGRPVVQAFAGSLEGKRANKGVLITTSCFSKDATEYVTQIGKKIVLIDGPRLAELMIDHDVGVATIVNYTVKRLDVGYFDEDE